MSPMIPDIIITINIVYKCHNFSELSGILKSILNDINATIIDPYINLNAPSGPFMLCHDIYYLLTHLEWDQRLPHNFYQVPCDD